MNYRKEAIRLAEIYLRNFTGKFRYRLFSMKNVEQSKWWSSFIKTASFFSDTEDWDPHGYVSFIFDLYEKPFPFVFVNQKNWIAFVEHKKSRTKDDMAMVKSLLATYNEIKDWTKKNKYDKIAVYDFFSDPKNMVFLRRGKFSPYFLSISKSFMRKYSELGEKEREEIMGKEELFIKRITVLNNEKLANKLKEVLGEEFIGFS